jgi:hypothetical protein
MIAWNLDSQYFQLCCSAEPYQTDQSFATAAFLVAWRFAQKISSSNREEKVGGAEDSSIGPSAKYSFPYRRGAP